MKIKLLTNGCYTGLDAAVFSIVNAEKLKDGYIVSCSELLRCGATFIPKDGLYFSNEEVEVIE